MPWREWIGDYVLGDLEAPLAAQLEEHLAGCTPCRVEVDELAGVARALQAAAPETLALQDAAMAQPSPGLERRILRQVRRERRRERPRWLLQAGAGLAAAALVGAVTVLILPRPPSSPPQEPVSLEVVEGVAAEASLVNHTWGIEIKLVASGLQGGRSTWSWCAPPTAGRCRPGVSWASRTPRCRCAAT